MSAHTRAGFGGYGPSLPRGTHRAYLPLHDARQHCPSIASVEEIATGAVRITTGVVLPSGDVVTLFVPPDPDRDLVDGTAGYIVTDFGETLLSLNDGGVEFEAMATAVASACEVYDVEHYGYTLRLNVADKRGLPEAVYRLSLACLWVVAMCEGAE